MSVHKLPPPADVTDDPQAPAPAASDTGGTGSRRAAVSRRLTPGAIVALGFILLILLASVAPGLLSPYDPYQERTTEVLLPPSSSYWFGTDYLGRDIFSRVIHGTTMSVSSALLAVAIGLVVGSTIGLISGHYAGRAVESALMRFIDTLIAIPGLLLSMAIVVALGFSTVNAAIAVGVSAIAVFARLMRSEVLRISKLPYLEAAQLIGARTPALIFSHVLRNSWSSVLALSILQFGVAILAIASLAFLGYGDSPPSPEWGVQVAEGQNYVFAAPWMVIFPSLAIVIAVLSFNRLSAFIKEVNSDD